MSPRAEYRPASSAFERFYRNALSKLGSARDPVAVGSRIGLRAKSLGVKTLALARLHDRVAETLNGSKQGNGKSQRNGSKQVNGRSLGNGRRAASTVALEERFFAEAAAHLVSPAREKPAPSAPAPASAKAQQLATALDRRTRELSVSRAKAEALQVELHQCQRKHLDMREQSTLMEVRLRRISHRLLSVQEEERLRISRDLHDAIGQTLTGINVGLATLRHEAAADSRELAEAITRAQQLVERSMRTVHQFAWELRPTLLDDLGLVPALRSYATLFAKRTGVKVHFGVDSKSYHLDDARKTALFRVAQGALSNVERHSHAKLARVTLKAIPGGVRLEVKDNGRAFEARKMETSKVNKHLGLLVMRERAEMVGGSFSIDSSKGRGTTVRVDVPLNPGRAGVGKS